MRWVWVSAVALAGGLWLSGCETMSADQCLVGDWGGRGYQDGLNGLRSDRLDDHAKACAKHGVTPNVSAYYSARELYETLQGVFQGLPNAKSRLTQILSCHCDDYQRCLYYALAGRGVVQMLDDLEWLFGLLGPRCQMSGHLLRSGQHPAPMVNPYVSSEPDGPVPARNADFTEGPSWYLDPGLGGMIEE